jgi:hypothetical protein
MLGVEMHPNGQESGLKEALMKFAQKKEGIPKCYF